VGSTGLAKSFVGLPGGETNEKGEADSPIKAARRTALDNKIDYRITRFYKQATMPCGGS
jgi:hypothetical protein